MRLLSRRKYPGGNSITDCQIFTGSSLERQVFGAGAGLLKAVRQVYNVFLLSKSGPNQQVAQGTLTQMVGTVFERVKTRIHMKEALLNLSKLGKSNGNTSSFTVDATDSINDAPGSNEGESVEVEGEATESEAPSSEEGQKLTLKDLENRKSFDDSNMGEGPT